MPVIRLDTVIDAPMDRCFDLACSIDFHMATSSKTQETAVAGVTSGLFGPNDTVTWRAKHFGMWQELTVKMVEYNRPYVFRDDMVKGAFNSMYHIHRFESKDGKTVMSDEFSFTSPLGIFGRLADVFLYNYMKAFLIELNQLLKAAVESSEWQRYL